MEFQGFPKLTRFSHAWTVTEKIDGTNAQIIIDADGNIGAASRKRLITPEDDNFGFAGWVERNREQLLLLGEGRHFGEWFGLGIQRRYGLEEKRFALFESHKWPEARPRPDCVEVVPVLHSGYVGNFSLFDEIMTDLKDNGSKINGFPDPEGIVMRHLPSGVMYKKTFDYDEQGKWAEKQQRAAA